MIDDTSINVYLPSRGNRIINKSDATKVFISKVYEDGITEYYCFDVDAMEFERIDNIIRFLIRNNISSLEKVGSRRKVAFLNQIGKTIEASKKPESLIQYKLILTKNKRDIKTL